MDKTWDAIAPMASLTRTVKLNVPTVVGVPLMVPELAFKLSPLGSDPAVIAQLYGVVPPVATSDVEYEMPVDPPGAEDVLIDKAGAITIDSAFVAAAPAASVTRTVKLNVPAADAFPLMVPVPEFKVRPAGSAPASRDQATGVVPPVLATVCEYAEPVTPPGKDEVVMTRAGATAMDNAFVAVTPLVNALSVTRTLKLNVPAADGVPLITPVPDARVTPLGREPPEIDHEYGDVPPVWASVWE